MVCSRRRPNLCPECPAVEVDGGFALLMASGASAQYSGQYGCTQDCEGHDAGYVWAEQNGIEDPGNCGGNSQSFVEGCQDYAEARQEEIRQAREDAGCDADDEDCEVD